MQAWDCYFSSPLKDGIAKDFYLPWKNPMTICQVSIPTPGVQKAVTLATTPQLALSYTYQTPRDVWSHLMILLFCGLHLHKISLKYDFGGIIVPNLSNKLNPPRNGLQWGLINFICLIWNIFVRFPLNLAGFVDFMPSPYFNCFQLIMSKRQQAFFLVFLLLFLSVKINELHTF